MNNNVIKNKKKLIGTVFLVFLILGVIIGAALIIISIVFENLIVGFFKDDKNISWWAYLIFIYGITCILVSLNLLFYVYLYVEKRLISSKQGKIYLLSLSSFLTLSLIGLLFAFIGYMYLNSVKKESREDGVLENNYKNNFKANQKLNRRLILSYVGYAISIIFVLSLVLRHNILFNGIGNKGDLFLYIIWNFIGIIYCYIINSLLLISTNIYLKENKNISKLWLAVSQILFISCFILTAYYAYKNVKYKKAHNIS
ncbi:hypothetical protein [Spiroplasma tabanidicola]|uniref:Uncharacterized protein n=1 Tax=Spiroplasma tabanidicola TaxID=324079 RepID=A0A6I6CJ79_9MOLU|nr:hypothetical protein [Spiroplasma tabanidicola]QGS52123.1 hypothetical protein STABA_v1c07670 [Spiroplasma tabanidicola]